MLRELQGTIRIIKIPDGESPEWIRKAWVGLEFPLHAEYAEGYAVRLGTALEILGRVSPDAVQRHEEDLMISPIAQCVRSRQQLVFIFKKNEVEPVGEIIDLTRIDYLPGLLKEGVGVKP